MKTYQKPAAEVVTLLTAEEIATGTTGRPSTPGQSGNIGVSNND